MELIYKLNLPKFEEIVIDSSNLPKDDNLNYNYLVLDPFKIIKTEFLNIAGIKFTLLLYFKKSNTFGSIHTDLDEISTTFRWSINWITEGLGIMEYWNPDQLTYVSPTTGALNIPNFGRVPKFIPKVKSPYRRYSLEPGAYLVNATVPHRASGSNNRKCYSLRCVDDTGDWNTVVNTFNNLIVR